MSSSELFSLWRCCPCLISYFSCRIFQLGTKLKQDLIPLSYTPRKFITHPGIHLLLWGWSSRAGWSRRRRHKTPRTAMQHTNCIWASCLAYPLSSRVNRKKIDTEVVNLPAEIFGRPKVPAGTWGSSIWIINPIEAKTVAVVPLEDNEVAFSLAVVPFSARGGNSILLVRQRVHYFQLDHVPWVTYRRVGWAVTTTLMLPSIRRCQMYRSSSLRFLRSFS